MLSFTHFLYLSLKARIILCCIRGRSDEALEVMELCDQLKNESVVGMDIAGDEGSFVDQDSSNYFTIFIIRTII